MKNTFVEDLYLNRQTECLGALRSLKSSQARVLDMIVSSKEGDDEKYAPKYKKFAEGDKLYQVTKADNLINIVSVRATKSNFEISTTIKYKNGLQKSKEYTAKLVNGVLFEKVVDGVGKVGGEIKFVENYFVNGKSYTAEQGK